jgi:hypothetical protein
MVAKNQAFEIDVSLLTNEDADIVVVVNGQEFKLETLVADAVSNGDAVIRELIECVCHGDFLGHCDLSDDELDRLMQKPNEEGL